MIARSCVGTAARRWQRTNAKTFRAARGSVRTRRLALLQIERRIMGKRCGIYLKPISEDVVKRLAYIFGPHSAAAQALADAAKRRAEGQTVEFVEAEEKGSGAIYQTTAQGINDMDSLQRLSGLVTSGHSHKAASEASTRPYQRAAVLLMALAPIVGIGVVQRLGEAFPEEQFERTEVFLPEHILVPNAPEKDFADVRGSVELDPPVKKDVLWPSSSGGGINIAGIFRYLILDLAAINGIANSQAVLKYLGIANSPFHLRYEGRSSAVVVERHPPRLSEVLSLGPKLAVRECLYVFPLSSSVRAAAKDISALVFPHPPFLSPDKDQLRDKYQSLKGSNDNEIARISRKVAVVARYLPSELVKFLVRFPLGSSLFLIFLGALVCVCGGKYVYHQRILAATALFVVGFLIMSSAFLVFLL